MPLKIAVTAKLLLTDATLMCSRLLLVRLSPLRPSYLLLSTTVRLSSCFLANAALLLVNCNELQVKVSMYIVHTYSSQQHIV